MRRPVESIVLVVALIALPGCDTSPTAPSARTPPGNMPPLASFAGTYTLTIEVADSCPFPPALKVRTYEVVLKVGSYRYLGVDVVGVDSFLGGDLWEPGAKGAGFMLKWNPWDDVSDCGYPDMRGPTALSLCGEGEGTANVSEGTIAGVLVGSAYLGEGPERPSCKDAQHRFVFRRRS